MSRRSTVLPLLKASGWAGREHALCRPLAPIDDARVPWVGFGWGDSAGFEFLARGRLSELEVDEATLEREAIARLAASKLSWNAREVDVGSGAVRLATCSGAFFSAEMLLDSLFMREGARLLGAETIAVAVPHRGFLAAIDAASDRDRLGSFASAAVGRYEAAVRGGVGAAITPLVLLVREGEILGRVAVKA